MCQAVACMSLQNRDSGEIKPRSFYSLSAWPFVLLPDREPRPRETVADLFANPPGWLPKQLEVYRKDPARHLKPLCATVAAEVLGDGLRGDEVREEVERILEEGAQG